MLRSLLGVKYIGTIIETLLGIIWDYCRHYVGLMIWIKKNSEEIQLYMSM